MDVYQGDLLGPVVGYWTAKLLYDCTPSLNLGQGKYIYYYYKECASSLACS